MDTGVVDSSLDLRNEQLPVPSEQLPVPSEQGLGRYRAGDLLQPSEPDVLRTGLSGRP